MDKVVKPVSVRFNEEDYERVRKYAEENNESLSDAVIRIVEKFFSVDAEPPGPKPEPEPTPRPEPEPSPPPAAEKLCEKVKELEVRMRELEQGEEETREGISQLAGQVEEIQNRVNEILNLLKPTLPVPPPVPWPPSPPWGFSRAGLRGRKERDRRPADNL